MKEVELKVSKNASARSKNRIGENGPNFMFQRVDRPACMSGAASVLVKSPRTGWFGWILLEDLEQITHVKND